MVVTVYWFSAAVVVESTALLYSSDAILAFVVMHVLVVVAEEGPQGGGGRIFQEGPDQVTVTATRHTPITLQLLLAPPERGSKHHDSPGLV